jgi:hypothetical protein
MTEETLLDHFRRVAALYSTSGLKMMAEETQRSKSESAQEWVEHADFKLWEQALDEELLTR